MTKHDSTPVHNPPTHTTTTQIKTRRENDARAGPARETGDGACRFSSASFSHAHPLDRRRATQTGEETTWRRKRARVGGVGLLCAIASVATLSVVFLVAEDALPLGGRGAGARLTTGGGGGVEGKRLAALGAGTAPRPANPTEGARDGVGDVVGDGAEEEDGDWLTGEKRTSRVMRRRRIRRRRQAVGVVDRPMRRADRPTDARRPFLPQLGEKQLPDVDWDLVDLGTDAVGPDRRDRGRRGGDWDGGANGGGPSEQRLGSGEADGAAYDDDDDDDDDDELVDGAMRGLVKHLGYVDGGGSARVLIVVKPGEWGLAYLQLASMRRWAPRVLTHVTVLTYDEATHEACSTQRGVDCFWDEEFVAEHKDLGATDAEAYREAIAWRKVHAAASLVFSEIPVVVLDADLVFLRDPSRVWREALSRYDVVCTADVGDENQAQRNMNTKVVILPAGRKSREIVRAWLEGESQLVEGINHGESPEQSYFNYVLVPTYAGHTRIHAMSAREASNFITLDRGENGAFGDTLLVTGSYCADDGEKQTFLQRVLEERNHAEEALTLVSDGRRGRPGRKMGLRDERSSRVRGKARIGAKSRALPLVPAVDEALDVGDQAGGDAGSVDGAGGGGGSRVEFSRQLKCDHAKRDFVFQGRYRVTDDRHIVWD